MLYLSSALLSVVVNSIIITIIITAIIIITIIIIIIIIIIVIFIIIKPVPYNTMVRLPKKKKKMKTLNDKIFLTTYIYYI